MLVFLIAASLLKLCLLNHTHLLSVSPRLQISTDNDEEKKARDNTDRSPHPASPESNPFNSSDTEELSGDFTCYSLDVNRSSVLLTGKPPLSTEGWIDKAHKSFPQLGELLVHTFQESLSIIKTSQTPLEGTAPPPHTNLESLLPTPKAHSSLENHREPDKQIMC